jgi:hypothetical protein
MLLFKFILTAQTGHFANKMMRFVETRILQTSAV